MIDRWLHLGIACMILFDAVLVAADEIPHYSCLDRVRSKALHVQSRIRPRMQFSVPSPSGKFLVHYDTLGINAVASGDRDGNGIPDYVDSAAYFMDSAYRFAIDTLGYREPPRDYVDTSSWDVYLVQLGRVPGFFFDDRDLGQFGWYGATFAEDLIPLPCGGYASTGFIFLDNDYSSRDSIGATTKRRTYLDTGTVALAITCYHEFHHLVQYGYFYGESPTFYEMTSVWIEQRAFPEIHNYVQYIRRLFSNPTLYCLSCDRSIEGSYGYSIAIRFLALQLGDDIVRSWWDGIGRCTAAPISLDSVVSARGRRFEDLWCQLLPWLYWTGSRAKHGYYSDAAILPELQTDNSSDDWQYTDPSWIRTISLYPLQFKLLRAVLPADQARLTPDTVDFVVTNPSARQLATDPRTSIDYTVGIARTPPGDRLGNSHYYCTRRTETNCDILTFRGGLETTTQQIPTPNPIIRSRNRELTLPVPSSARAGSSVTIQFLTTEGIEVYRTTATVDVRINNRRSVTILTDDGQFPRQGVFIAIVRAGDDHLVTKIAVLP
ncbi:MAG: hypothetical protein N2663_00805 [Chlorobi bacterium]|nr:hypothetical protein [Chlorobiota bacterium]